MTEHVVNGTAGGCVISVVSSGIVGYQDITHVGITAALGATISFFISMGWKSALTWYRARRCKNKGNCKCRRSTRS